MPTARPSVPRLVIGCGNLLRGDDAVGPLVVRRLGDRRRPSDLRCVDAGTAGLDVVSAMRGAAEVTIVDACRSGAEPGTILELSGDDLATLDSSIGLSIHDLRWSDALALGRLLPADGVPANLRVWLVEGGGFEPGRPLTPAVDRAVEALVERLLTGSGPTACGTSGRIRRVRMTRDRRKRAVPERDPQDGSHGQPGAGSAAGSAPGPEAAGGD